MNALQGLELDVLNWLATRDYTARTAMVELENVFPNATFARLVTALVSLMGDGFIIYNGTTIRLTLSCINFLSQRD